jgi:hypothetical protein
VIPLRHLQKNFCDSKFSAEIWGSKSCARSLRINRSWPQKLVLVCTKRVTLRGMSHNLIRKQIVAALSHSEAEDGLYFNNLVVVHEEEERPIVEGEEAVIRAVLKEMIAEGVVRSSGEGAQEIFSLTTN